MRFLIFNIVVGAALFYLFTTDRVELQQKVEQVKGAATKAVDQVKELATVGGDSEQKAGVGAAHERADEVFRRGEGVTDMGSTRTVAKPEHRREADDWLRGERAGAGESVRESAIGRDSANMELPGAPRPTGPSGLVGNEAVGEGESGRGGGRETDRRTLGEGGVRKAMDSDSDTEVGGMGNNGESTERGTPAVALVEGVELMGAKERRRALYDLARDMEGLFMDKSLR